jgi:AbrB family looped-hinge helix DNA binding protein
MTIYKVTVDSRGRFTLPRGVRDALGLRPGDRYILTSQDDGSVALTKGEPATEESDVKRTLDSKG